MIPVSKPDLSDLERRYLLDAFDSGWISSRGAYIERAEERLRSLTGAPFSAVCNNGTTALHLALLAAGIGPGDEVILPSLTYIATLNAVYYIGAEPIIVDVDPDTWCISAEAVLAAITARTAAIIAVDLYGLPADYRALRLIADEHQLTLIADAAESIGASQDGAATGTLADITTFSFFGNKVITSGEGGAITTDSEEAHARILQLRNQGNHPEIRYHHDVVGYNYRMTNLSAAVLTAQLERADELIARRRRVTAAYKSLLEAEARVRLQLVAPGMVESPWMLSARLLDVTAEQRDDVISGLAERGVESRPVFHPVQSMPFVLGKHRSITPISEVIAREGISLPTYPALTEHEIEYVVKSLCAVLADVTGPNAAAM